MQIGKYKLSVVESATIGLDGGAMFGVVPKPLWEKTNPPDESNRVTLATRCLLLQSEDKTILIDTGTGDNWDPKFEKIYRINYSHASLLDSLAQHGVNREDVTDVILTHLHFDHTGGSVIFDGDKILPAFPNAKYHVQQKQFEWALNPSDRDRASFVANRFMPLMDEGILNLIDGPSQFDDQIEFLVVNGHTLGQQLVKIADSSRTLLYTADLFAFSAHVPVPYLMGYDLQPLETVKEKKYILPMAVEENWMLYFEHDPFIPAATVTQTDKGFSLKEKFESLPNG